MALAILRADEGIERNRRSFRYDIGQNRYYHYAIGGPERRQQDGIILLAEPTHVSELCGPCPEEAMGMGRFDVDEGLFAQGSEFVQMMSYASRARNNPAISAIVRSKASLPAYPPHDRMEGFGSTRSSASGRRAPRPQALFIADLLRAVAPAIVSLIGSTAAKSDGAPAADRGASAPAPVARLLDPATIKLLRQLVEQIGGLPASSPASKTQAQALGAYSEAMIAPALLAALPALVPLLQQVLNPQTIKALVDAPTQGAATIMNGINDVLKLGLEAEKAQLKHLEAIHPSLDDPAMNRLMEGLSVWRGSADRRDAYRRTTRVRLAFDGLRSVTAAGRSRILFAQGRPVTFPLIIELPRLKSGNLPSLLNPSLLLEVKDPVTLAVRKRVHSQLPTITDSGIIQAAELPASDAAELEPGRDWLFSVTLTWTSKQGEKIGVTMSTLGGIAGPAVYDGLSDEGETLDLADPTRDRAFWHRVWNGRFAPEAKKFETEIDYAYRFDPNEPATRRIDSRVRTRAAENAVARTEALVESELVYGPDALTHIAITLGLDSQPLSHGERAALRDAALLERLSLAARVRLPIRGRPGEPFAFWAYPAVRRARIRLASPSEVLETGNIAALETYERPFLVPVALNLIGSRGR